MITTRILFTATVLVAICSSAVAASTQPQQVSMTQAVTPDSSGKTIRAFSLNVVNQPVQNVLNDLFAAAGEKERLSNHVHGMVTAKVNGRSFGATLSNIFTATRNGEIWTDDDIKVLNRVQGHEMANGNDHDGFYSPNPYNTWAVAVNHGSAQAMMTKLKSGKAGAPFDEFIWTTSDDHAVVYRGDRQKFVILRSMVASLDK